MSAPKRAPFHAGTLPPPDAEKDVPLRHDPTLYSASRYGTWATCTCGWKSAAYRTGTGAHLAFGEHLASVTSPGVGA